MSIRTKLLALLLIITLVPIVFLSAINRSSMQSLGAALAQETQASLEGRATRELQQLIAAQAGVVSEKRLAIEQTLVLQAAAVQRALAEPPSAQPFYTTEQFAAAAGLPFVLSATPTYQRVDARGGAAPLPVSFDHPVMRLAPGSDADVAREDLARLAGLTPQIRALYQSRPDIFWHYTALENGAHSLFPGHAGLDADLDPRARAWYQLAKVNGGVQWVGPYVDASSRQLVLTVCKPVFRADQNFAGVTAVDVTMRTIAASLAAPTRHWPSADVMLVALLPGEERQRLAVIARAASDAAPQDAAAGPTEFLSEWLEADDPAQLEALAADVLQAHESSRRFSYKGVDSLWVHGPVNAGRSSLVVRLAYSDVIAEATRMHANVVDRTRTQLAAAGAIGLLVFVMVVLAALVASRSVTDPVRKLVEAADRLAQGDFESRVDVHSGDELGKLAEHFNAMVPQLQDRVRLKQSLALAMEVQQHLLPAHPPQIPGIDVAGASVYCDETGGDYYDFLELSELGPRQLGIAIGDVTGHGVAAAMLMATARALLRSQAAQPGAVAAMMTGLNRYLASDMIDGRFMTLFYLVLDANTQRMHWSSAGHDAVITYSPATATFGELDGEDLPLGVDPAWQFKECGPMPFEPGQVLVLGTDGIWESRNPQGEFFGKDRLRGLIREHAGDSARKLADVITAALGRFRGPRAQEDDVTLVVLKMDSAPGHR